GSPPEYPAALPHVLTVGALDQTSQPTFFTTGSSHVDLSAPGERIWVAVPPSLHPPDYYDQFDGTSFSSPMVAAASAWVWTARPTLDASQVFDVMRASAQDVWTPGFDSFTGFGRLDIPTALTVAPPPRDPQEPNEDVSYVKPGGFLHRSTTPLTTARHKSGSIAARLDRGDDPRDVYRLWVPAGKSVSVALQPTGGGGDLPPLGSPDGKRARGRAGAEAGRSRDLGTVGNEARAPAGQEHRPDWRLLLRRGLLRGRQTAGRGRDQLPALGLDRHPEEASSTLTDA